MAFRLGNLRRWGIVGLLILGGWIGACAPAAPEALGSMASSPLPAAPSPVAEKPLLSPLPSATLVPTLTPPPTATPRPTPRPGQLVVLHTNDNWGETEPCG